MHSEQAAPDLLQKSLDASGVGWWQLDFGQREMTCSRLRVASVMSSSRMTSSSSSPGVL